MFQNCGLVTPQCLSKGDKVYPFPTVRDNTVTLPNIGLFARESDRPGDDSSRIAHQKQHSSVPEDSDTLTNAVKYGSLGGLVATLSMTVFRMPTSKSLPPTAVFWAKYVGSGDPEDYPVIALVLHLLYGVTSGIMFALLTPGRGDSEEVAESKGAVLGTVYGIVLSIFGSRIVLERVLGLTLETDERLVFHISHVVYGLTLGTWVGSRFGDDK